jgi:hypothetical protein
MIEGRQGRQDFSVYLELLEVSASGSVVVMEEVLPDAACSVLSVELAALDPVREIVVIFAGASNCLALARPNHLDNNTSIVPSLFISLKVVLRAVAKAVFVVR